MKTVSLAVAPANFYDAAKKHVKELTVALGADYNRPVVLDQPFQGNNPQACFPFFEDPYAIVVDRDPRDIYVFAKEVLIGRNHYMAIDNVHDFINYFRAMRDNQPYKCDNERILRLHFEDMVYNYDATTKRISDFLQIGDNPRPMTIFDPKLSVANTQVYKRFPKYADDVKIIEKELGEYLYDFSKYNQSSPGGKMFFGKSPLRRK